LKDPLKARILSARVVNMLILGSRLDAPESVIF